METISVERNGGLVTITMDRPAVKNAINDVMFAELTEAFTQVERDNAVRALLLTGANGDFCTGADLSPGAGPSADPAAPGITRMRRLNELALALHQIAKPTVAKVDGLAVGAGLSLALGCDLVVASERARFSAIFARRGLSPDLGASWLLPRVVGLQRAKELALLGEMIDAPTALRYGIAYQVVPLGALDVAAAELATRLAQGPTIALGLTKRLLNDALGLTMAEALEAEGRAQAINFTTEDTVESLKAFVHKRDPEYRGR